MGCYKYMEELWRHKQSDALRFLLRVYVILNVAVIEIECCSRKFVTMSCYVTLTSIKKISLVWSALRTCTNYISRSTLINSLINQSIVGPGNIVNVQISVPSTVRPVRIRHID